MELEITTKVVNKVEASNLESFIHHVYGQHYSVEADLEMGHDDIEEVNAEKNSNDESTTEELQNIITNGDGCLQDFSTFVIMNDLVDRGLIKEQLYSIETC